LVDIEIQLLRTIVEARDLLEGYRGVLRNQMDCLSVMSFHDRVARLPTFDLTGASAEARIAHQIYREKIDGLLDEDRAAGQLALNCRNLVAAGETILTVERRFREAVFIS
jgi:hypothetical protein